MTVRRALPDDAVGITTVRIDAWLVAYRDIVDPEFLAAQSYEQDAITLRERLLMEEAGAVASRFRLVAESEGQVIGFCVCDLPPEEPYAGEWFMIALYVSPLHMGQGAGRALTEEAKAEGQRRGMVRMLFEVFTANEPAKAFYRRTGASFVRAAEKELAGRLYPVDVFEYRLAQ
jgi:ribosomal protein S18 acetylase RimI-like enzyme